MAKTATKTGISTKAIAAVAVVAAIGLIGYSAAIMFPKFVLKPDLTVVISGSSDSDPMGLHLDPLIAGETVTHTITIGNPGRKLASGVQTVITLPSELTYVSYTTGSTGLTCSVVGQTVTCTGNVAAGKSNNVRIMSTVARVCNSASITTIANVDPLNKIVESNEKNNSASESLTLGGATCADLSVSVIGNDIDRDGVEDDIDGDGVSDVISFNDPYAYTIVITNNGADESGVFTHTLDTGLERFGGSFNQDTTTTDCTDDAAGKYTCTIKSIAPGDSVTWYASSTNTSDVNVPCNDTQNIEVTGTVDTDNDVPETDESNNVATKTTTLEGNTDCAELSMTITEDTDPVPYDSDSSYDIAVRNDGASSPDAFDFTVTVPSAAGAMSYGNPGFLTCVDESDESAVVIDGVEYNRLTCTANLAAGEEATIDMSLHNDDQAACDETAGITVSGVVDTTNTVEEDDETNNTVSETTTFEGEAC